MMPAAKQPAVTHGIGLLRAIAAMAAYYTG